MSKIVEAMFPIGRTVFYAAQCENGSRLSYPFRVMNLSNDKVTIENFNRDVVVCDINDRKLCLTSEECFAVCAAYNSVWAKNGGKV